MNQEEVQHVAVAVCTQCGRQVYWAASRGSRLRDLSCPQCGGKLRSSGAGAPRRHSPFAGLRTPKEYRRYPYRQYYRDGLRWGYAGIAWVDRDGRLHVEPGRQLPYFTPPETETAFRAGVEAGRAAKERQGAAEPCGPQPGTCAK